MLEPHPYADDSVSLQQYLGIARRRWWVIAGTVAVLLAAGGVVTALTKPIYEARTKLIVRAARNYFGPVLTENPVMDLLWMTQPEPINVQLAWLESGGFKREVFREAEVPDGVPVQLRASADKETNIISIRVTSGDPEVAARVANTAAEHYLERTDALSLQGILRAQEFVERAASQAQRDLRRAEDALGRYRRSIGASQPGAEQQRQLQELISLEAQSRQTQSDVLRLEAQLQALRAQLAQQREHLATETVQENPRHRALQSKLAELAVERELLLQTHRPGSTRVRALDGQIAAIEARVSQESPHLRLARQEPNPRYLQIRSLMDGYEAELHALRAQRTRLEQEVGQQRQRVLQLQPGPAEIRLAQFERDRDMAEKSYLLLAGKLEDLKIREKARNSTARLLEGAIPPRSPIRPRPARNMMLALFVGVLLGCCLAMVMEYLDDRVTAAEQIDRLLGLPFLGAIPPIPGSRRLMHTLPPYSTAAESYRGLRSAVSFAAAQDPFGTLGVTSTRAGEGKTLTAINLALAMAMDGRRVILVDADLRWPSVHRKLDLPPSPGLTDLLAGHCSLEQALQPLPGHDVRVLTSGPIPTNPAELLNTAGMQSLIDQIRGEADIVIFDTPPCVPFTDAHVLGARLDAMLLVTEVGEARKGEVQRARELLDQARIRFLGVVANKAQGTYSRSYARYAAYRREAFDNGNGRPLPPETLPESTTDPTEPPARHEPR